MTKKTKKGKITIDRELCKGCYLCISVCPSHLIAVSDKLNLLPNTWKQTAKKKIVSAQGALCVPLRVLTLR